MFCHYCGNRMPNDAAFCNNCGNKVPQVSQGSPTNSEIDPTMRSGPPSQPPLPVWQPTVQAGPPSQPFQQRSGPISQPGYPPYQQPSGPVSSPGWQPTVQAGPPSQPSWSNWPPQPGQQPGQFGSPSIPYSPQQQPPSSYPSWPGVAGAPFQPPPQPDRPTAPPPPPSPFQHWLIRTFQPSLAGNAILGIVLGALVAVVLGGAIAVILEAIFHALAPSFGFSNNLGASGQDILDYSLGLIPLHAPFRDGMQLFFLMHGFAAHVQYTPGGFYSSYNSNATLNGLLIIPALALTLGGYIAASTDLQNRAVSSLLRGAAIAIPYAALLIALAPQVNGNLPLFPGAPTTDVNTFTIDSTSLLLYGLIWGAIFGLLGATLKLGRGRWRHMVVQFLHTRPRPH